MSSSKVGVEGVKEDDVHVADHEGRLDGDGGDEVDGGLVEEEVVGDAWHQGEVAAAIVVELLKSYVTYLVQYVFGKTAETFIVKSREEWGNTKLVLPFKREDACKSVKSKVDRGKEDEKMKPAQKINPHLFFLPWRRNVDGATSKTTLLCKKCLMTLIVWKQ